MTQTLVSAVVAIVGSLIGLAARNTRRTRLLKKADSYTVLADSLEVHDPAAAATLRALVNEIVQALVDAERKSLRKRLNTDSLIGVIAVLVIALGIFGFALSLDSAWLRVPGYFLAGLIAFLALIAATQIWSSHDDKKGDATS